MTVPRSEIQTCTPGTVIELFELDATALGGSIFRFHNGLNFNKSDIVWQGNTYLRYPVQASGFEMSSKGVLPRPKLTVANISNAVAAEVRAYGDLVGAKVTRKRTLAKFLDVCNFPTLQATSEPFVPSGTSGQLYVGSTPITVDAAVSSLVRTDWQGTVALSASPRTNYLPKSQNMSGWTKDFPTNTTITTGVLDPKGGTTAITLAASGGVADIYITRTNSAPGVWYGSIWVKRRVGTGVVRVNPPDLSPSFVIYPDETWRKFELVSTTSTIRTLGVAVSVANGSSIDVAFGQLSDSLGSYIPTTTAPVTLTDYAVTDAGNVTLGETASGTYAWTGSGKGNATADPTAAFADDVFYVERKSEENNLQLEFELSAACDLQGLLLPRRIVQATCCMHNDAAVCPYSVGGVCPKTLAACQSRYGSIDLPFGGFPGSNLVAA